MSIKSDKKREDITPYGNEKSKKEQVEDMFDSIAGKYDFLNHFLSFGIDKIWRRKLINIVKKNKHDLILDVATGTGDLAIQVSALDVKKIIGVDLSNKMLEKGKSKIQSLQKTDVISLMKADAEELPFEDQYFDVVMVAFGIRNFENLSKGLQEIRRVLKSKGLFVILEFSKPKKFPVKQIYKWYSKKFLPFAGKNISGDQKAYTYLPDSVEKFLEGDDLVKILKNENFYEVKYKPLTFSIVTLYYCVKL